MFTQTVRRTLCQCYKLSTIQFRINSAFNLKNVLDNHEIVRHETRYHTSIATSSVCTTKVSTLSETENSISNKTVAWLKDVLQCESNVAQEILESIDIKKQNLQNIKRITKYLFDNSVTVPSIKNNRFLLSLANEEVRDRFKLISAMNPTNINDLIPLMELKTKHLRCVLNVHQTDIPILNDLGECNRIYLFSKKFNLEPSDMAKIFANNLFMLVRSLQRFVVNFDLVTHLKLPPERVLNDLRCLTSSQDVIRARLKRATIMGIDRLMPWMIRCNEETFERKIERNTIKKEALGNNKDIIKFFQNEIGLDQQMLLSFAKNAPRLLQRNVKTIKDMKDFIINETPFTKTTLAQNPYIFLHNIAKIKKRFNELKAIDCSFGNINALIYSEKAYKIYLNEQQQIQLNSPVKKCENSLGEACNNLQIHLPNCSKAEAIDLCDSYPKILKISANQLITNIKTLVNYNVHKEFIYENPSLLAEEPGEIICKYDILNAMKPRKFKDFLPLITATKYELGKIFKEIADGKHPIYHISDALNVYPKTVAEHIALKSITLPSTRFLEHRINILLKGGMEPMNILRNMHLLCFSSQYLEDRVKYVQLAGIKQIKPAMIIMQKRVFNEKLSTYLKQQLELEKFPDRLTHFLANVLGITDKSILEFRRKYHMISPEQFVDVEELVYHLYAHSYNVNDISRRLIILYQDPNMFRCRLEELKKLGHVPKTLGVLCRPEYSYRKYVTKIIDQVNRKKLRK